MYTFNKDVFPVRTELKIVLQGKSANLLLINAAFNKKSAIHRNASRV